MPMTWEPPAARLPGTTLMEGERLPDVALAEAHGGAPWRPSQLRQRSALVLCFVHPQCPACERFMTGIAEPGDGLSEFDAQVRAVMTEAAPSALPVVLDRDGRARRRMLGAGGELPCVIVADRYSTAVEAYPAAGHDFPAATEVFATLHHLAILCPECSV